jgi:hypothetical protein
MFLAMSANDEAASFGVDAVSGTWTSAPLQAGSALARLTELPLPAGSYHTPQQLVCALNRILVRARTRAPRAQASTTERMPALRLSYRFRHASRLSRLQVRTLGSVAAATSKTEPDARDFGNALEVRHCWIARNKQLLVETNGPHQLSVGDFVSFAPCSGRAESKEGPDTTPNIGRNYHGPGGARHVVGPVAARHLVLKRESSRRVVISYAYAVHAHAPLQSVLEEMESEVRDGISVIPRMCATSTKDDNVQRALAVALDKAEKAANPMSRELFVGMRWQLIPHAMFAVSSP